MQKLTKTSNGMKSAKVGIRNKERTKERNLRVSFLLLLVSIYAVLDNTMFKRLFWH